MNWFWQEELQTRFVFPMTYSPKSFLKGFRINPWSTTLATKWGSKLNPTSKPPRCLHIHIYLGYNLVPTRRTETGRYSKPILHLKNVYAQVVVSQEW